MIAMSGFLHHGVGFLESVVIIYAGLGRQLALLDSLHCRENKR